MERFWYIFYMKESESIYQVSSWALEIINQIRSLSNDILEKEVLFLRRLSKKFDHVVAAIKESKDFLRTRINGAT